MIGVYNCGKAFHVAGPEEKTCMKKIICQTMCKVFFLKHIYICTSCSSHPYPHGFRIYFLLSLAPP